MSFFIIILLIGVFYWLQDFLYRSSWHKGFMADIDFDSNCLYEGESMIINQLFENNKWLPLPIMEVDYYVSRNARSYHEESKESDLISNEVLSIKSYSRLQRKIKVPAVKRGFYRIPSLNIKIYNLFLTENFQYVNNEEPFLYVYPTILEGEQLEVIFNKLLTEFITKRFTFEDPFLIKGVREYQIYDPQRAINWNASARVDKLMVNQYENSSNQEVKLVLNLTGLREDSDELLFEESIRLAASLALRSLDKGIPTGLITNGNSCLDYHSIRLPALSGKNQKTAIMQSLSSLMVVRRLENICTMLEEEVENRQRDNSIYIVISSDASEDLQDFYGQLAQKFKGSLWIMPVSQGKKELLSAELKQRVTLWEVCENEA